MKFIALTLKYLKHNFFKLLILAAGPAVLFAFFARPSLMLVFITQYGAEKLTFGNIYAALFPAVKWWWLFLLLPVLAIFMSMTYGFLENHMRMGVFGPKSFIRKLNYGAGGFVLPFIILSAVYFLWRFLTATVLYLINYLFFDVWGSYGLALAFSIAAVLGSVYIFISAAAYFLLWPPVLQISGYGFGDSWYYQLKMLSDHRRKLKLAILFPLALTAAVVLIFIQFAGAYIVCAYAVCYAFEFTYLPALSMATYFDITGSERKDLVSRKKYYLR